MKKPLKIKKFKNESQERNFWAKVNLADSFDGKDFGPASLSPKPNKKILFVASEAAPFAKAGGLGEVLFALPRALVNIGYDARVIIPRYAGVDPKKFKLAMEYEGLQVPTDAEEMGKPKILICNVKKYAPHRGSKFPVTTYFLENMEYYEQRANVYGYADDAVRWVLLCRGVLEFLRVSRWVPDIIICADWQTGFLPNFLKTVYKRDSVLGAITTIFSIHNIAYQGMFNHRFVAESDMDDGRSPIGSFFNPRVLKLNGMRRGIMYADLLTTVSSTYAQEIMTPEFGGSLEGLLREKRSRLYGVLNAIDYSVYNPKKNPNVPYKYTVGSLDKRAENKKELQRRFGLAEHADAFLLAIVSRFTEQKGFDLLPMVMDMLLSELDIQLLVVGTGDTKYMKYIQELGERFPGKVSAHLQFDPDLPHLVYAGADGVLIPSKYEPAGLCQMEAMRYGCVPIVRKTGGLADTVEDYHPAQRTGTGFVFAAFDSMALSIAVTRAREIFRHKKLWREIQKSGMRKDFSWDRSALEYSRLFTVATQLAEKDRAGAE